VVAHTGATGGPGRVRPLNRPRPVRVEADGDGRPIAVHLSNGRFAVQEVLETWRIDDEWWRPRPISRVYYALLLEGGRTVTLYRDTFNFRWFQQAYQSVQTATKSLDR